MLVVTIHDVAPPTLAAVTALRELAARWGATRVTLLAVPNFHGTAPLAAHAPTVDWLRRCADDGDEIALHGLRHMQAAPTGITGALRARIFTAGEAEMLGDGAGDPVALADARDALAQLSRTPVRGFVAPAWLEPPRFGEVLARGGFDWHETGLRLERLRDRRWFASPVIGFATRTPARMRASLAWAAMLTPVLERLARAGLPARVALHPGDLASRRVLAAAEQVIRRLARAHAAITTAAALGLGT
jgi:uncharacterized protein